MMGDKEWDPRHHLILKLQKRRQKKIMMENNHWLFGEHHPVLKLQGKQSKMMMGDIAASTIWFSSFKRGDERTGDLPRSPRSTIRLASYNKGDTKRW